MKASRSALLPPCATCSVRQFGFCDALHGAGGEEAPIEVVGMSYEGRRANQILYEPGYDGPDVFVLCHGWAYQFRRLADGRRQILSLLLPGDLFSPRSVLADRLGFSVQALTEVRFTRMDRENVRRRVQSESRVLEALAGECADEMRGKDELLLNLGRRSAEERIAYLILRVMERFATRNVVREGRFPWPLRQQHIADFTGLTPVHVSRVMSEFRKAGIIELSKSVLTVLDEARLQAIGQLR